MSPTFPCLGLGLAQHGSKSSTPRDIPNMSINSTDPVHGATAPAERAQIQLCICALILYTAVSLSQHLGLSGEWPELRSEPPARDRPLPGYFRKFD